MIILPWILAPWGWKEPYVDTRQRRRPVSSEPGASRSNFPEILHTRQLPSTLLETVPRSFRIIHTIFPAQPSTSHIATTHSTSTTPLARTMAIRTTITRYSFLALGVFAAAAIAAPVQDGQPSRVHDRAPATCVTGSPADSAYDMEYATAPAPATSSSYDIDASFHSANAVGSAMVSPSPPSNGQTKPTSQARLSPAGVCIRGRADNTPPPRRCTSALIAIACATMPRSSASTPATARLVVFPSSAGSCRSTRPRNTLSV